jgi:hypothetical protein
MLPVVWVVCAVVIITAAVRCRHHGEGARRLGRAGVGALYLGAGALVNAGFLIRGDDYQGFADGAYVSFVRETWESLVVPHHEPFIWLLVAFEATVGVLALSGGRRTQAAYALAIAFHVALLSFGWGFYVWSIPMIWALVQLLRSERASDRKPARTVIAATIAS